MIKINDNIEIDEAALAHLKRLAVQYGLDCDKLEDLELAYNIHNITTIQNIYAYNPENDNLQYIVDYIQKASNLMNTSQFKNIKEVLSKRMFEGYVLDRVTNMCIKYFNTKTDFAYH